MNWFRKRGRKSARAPERPVEQPTGRVEAAPPARSRDRAAATPGFPRFQVLATDELDARHRDPFAAARLKLRKAYTPAQPIRDRELFAGRRGLVSSVIRAVEDERVHLIAYGPRGVGKTSLLHVIADTAREARYLVSYVSCGATASFDETFRAIAADIPLMYHASYGPRSPEAERGGVFADLLPPEPVSARFAADLCTKISGTRVLVIVDEFDRCDSPTFRRDVAEFLKNLSDRSVRAQLLIAGVAENLDDLLEAGVLLQRNVVALEVPAMDGDELRDLIRVGQEVSGLSFDNAAMDLLIAAASGLPYIASLLAQHAGLSALSDDRMVVGPGDLLSAIDHAIAEMKGRIPRSSRDHLSSLRRQKGEHLLPVLAKLARTRSGGFTEEDIQAASSGPLEAARAQTLAERLAQDQVFLAKDGDAPKRYHFLDPSIAPLLWLLAIRSASDDQGAQRLSAERT